MKRGGIIFLWIVCGLAMVALLTFITQQLWNWLVPVLFNGPFITFWQTLGLLVLSKVFFSGLGRKGNHGGPQWKARLKEKFAGMSHEEKEAFRRKMRQKWQNWCPDDARTSGAPAEKADNTNV